MIGRSLKILFLGIILFSGSLLLQTSVYQPASAVTAGNEFREVSAKLCVDYVVGDKFAVHVTGGELAVQSKGLLSSKEAVQPGDCFTAKLQLSSTHGFTRYAFNARLKHLLSKVSHNSQNSIFNLLRSYANSFRGDPANLVAGLAIGIDQGLSEQFQSNMKTTGLTHLTAVSGANCAIVLGAFWLLARALRLGRNLRFLMMVCALVSYVVLVGPQPSVLRAAFMMVTAAFALEFGRRVWMPAALGVGSIILLILDPWLVADIGFWLSALATFGLVILTPTLFLKFREKMPDGLAVGLSATLAAQIWCLPILVQLQGGLTTYSVLANLLVEPMVPVITLLGLSAISIGAMVPLVGDFLMLLAALPASWMVFVSTSLANAPAGLLAISPGTVSALFVGLFVVALTFALVRKSFAATAIWVALSMLWLGNQAYGIARAGEWPIEGWSVVNCDVGQGDAMVIRSEREIAVVDVGKDDELIDQCLDRLGVHRIDLLVLTHFDYDHVGGLAGLERGRTIARALISPFPDPRPEAQALTNHLRTVAGKVDVGRFGSTGNLGDYQWNVFSSLATSAQTANQGSLGVKFESDDQVIYTMADLDATAQLAAVGVLSSSDKPTLVKVSHHGSADQSEEFYRKVSADLAIISVGKGNGYGHPTQKILNILEVTGSKVLRTDLAGAISIRADVSGFEARVMGAR